MTLFWIIGALMLLVAVLFAAVPLWRGMARNNTVVRDAANLEIYRDQLAEMDADLKNGLLTPELHEQGKRELEARLLDEVRTDSREAALQRNPFKSLTIFIAVALPVLSVGVYLMVGNQNAFLPQPVMGGFGGAVHTESALQTLENRAAESPNDPEVWLMLARSYTESGRYPDAARAYDSLTKLVPDEAMLWADYADALAMTHSSLLGAPTKLLERALLLDPNNAKALALSGSAAMERGEFAAAVRHWQKLRDQLQDGSEDARMIDGALQEARQMLAQSKGGKAALEQINRDAGKTQAAAAHISGTVSLSKELIGKVGPEDTVFVLARAAQGPKMPLAILKKQVKDLPLSFMLDDSMAMTPEMKMSNFDQLVVVARVSKSGNAMPQQGDLQGMSGTLRPRADGVKVVIDQTVR